MLLPGSPAEWSYFSKDTFIWKCLLHNFINFLFLKRGRTLPQPPPPPSPSPCAGPDITLFTTFMHLKWQWGKIVLFSVTASQGRQQWHFTSEKNHRWRRLIVDNHSFWGNANSWIKFVRGYQSWSNVICSLINLCTLLWFKLRKFWFKTKFKGVIKTKTDFNFCTGWCTPAEFTTVSLLHINSFLQIYVYLCRQCQVS